MRKAVKFLFLGRIRKVVWGSFVGVIFCLTSLFLVWSAEASNQKTGHNSAQAKNSLSSPETIYIEFFYTGDNLSSAASAATDFADLLSQEAGETILATVSRCEAAIIENLGTGHVDLAALSLYGYAHGSNAYSIQAKLVNHRFGSPFYRSQINVPKSEGYSDIWDLQNKRFAMSIPGSTSGQFVPHFMILDATGMTPSEFFAETYFAGSHAQVIHDVYDGVTDCGATFQDARDGIDPVDYPNVKDVVGVLMVSDPIPNDPWAFRPGIDETLAQTLSDGIIAVAGTPQGQAALTTIFGSGFGGVETTQDSAYDIIRDIISEFDLELTPCLYNYLPIVTK